MIQHEIVIVSHSKDDQFLKFHGNEAILTVDSEEDARFIVGFLAGQAALMKDALAKARASK